VIPIRPNRIIITGAAAALLGGVLLWWLLGDHYPSEVILRVPGMDNRPKIEPRSDSVFIGEFFDTLGIFDGEVSGSWPRFRGASFDNISRDTTPVAFDWDSMGPPVAKVTLGEGYAGPSVYKGRVYILDYNERVKQMFSGAFRLNRVLSSGGDGIMSILKEITAIQELFLLLR
jgi:outer membrane protein assembly factor BamB